MSFYGDIDFMLEVSKGDIPKHSRVNKAGYNVDVDTAAGEDVWDRGGNWVAPTVARIHNITSSSASDTVAGIGARTLMITGLDGSYSRVSETINMNGTVAVATVNSYIIIDFMACVTFGSSGTAIGAIQAQAQTDLTVTALINIGFNQTNMAIYQVAVGYKLFLNKIGAAMSQATASSFAEVYLIHLPFGGGKRVRRVILLNNSGNSHEIVEMKPPIEIGEKDLIIMRCNSVTNNNTQVQASFDGVLVEQ